MNALDTVRRTQFDIHPDDNPPDDAAEYGQQPTLLDNGNVECHNCGTEYQRIGHHWGKSHSCDYPTLPSHIKEVMRGLLMGDGYVGSAEGQTPYLQLPLTNKSFLDWLDEKLRWFSTGVKKTRTASESAEYNLGRDFSTAVNEENYSDVYKLQTRVNPWFETLESWYSSGSKEFPDDLELTSTVAKYWYVSDGNLRWTQYMEQPEVEFTTILQSHRRDYLTSLFEQHSWKSRVANDRKVVIPREQTDEILEWMGPAPPGFEYKWATESMSQYKRLKDGVN
jgi:hypothetical protein